MEKTKTNHRILTALFASLLFVFALILSACGGEPIERQEALDAINSALSTEVLQSVKDFEVKMTYEVTETENDEKASTKQVATLRVDGDSNVGYQTMNLSMTLKMDGAVTGNAKQEVSTQYYIGLIGETAYKVNAKEKVYQLETENLDTYFNFERSLGGMVSVPSDEQLTKVTKEDHVKNGEGSYNLSFVITETQPQSETQPQEEKDVTTVHYVIRDGKITKLQQTYEQYVAGKLVSEQIITLEIDYSSVSLKMPTTSLEGYTEGDFDISM